MNQYHWQLLITAVSLLIVIKLYLWLTRHERAKKKRGWNDPYNYTNWITFLLHDGKRIMSLEKGEKLEEILEDMTVVINHQSFYKLTYPNSPSQFETFAPVNPEQTPYLQMMLPYHEVAQVWMQREYKGLLHER